jgi:hypothetical protein
MPEPVTETSWPSQTIEKPNIPDGLRVSLSSNAVTKQSSIP